jgi:hypothetical protein
MDTVLDTFVIARMNKPRVTIRQYTTRLASIIIEYKNGTFAVDWPIRYDNGQVAYDNPYAIPAYAKRFVERVI